MPPKKEAVAGDKLLVGFEDRDTKLIAAAFLSCTGPDKYDYELMASLTKNTAGSLKKMWPPVKKKAIEAHPSFAIFLGTAPSNIAAAPTEVKAVPASKAAGGRKRKAANPAEETVKDDAEDEVDPSPEPEEEKYSNAKATGTRSKSIKSDGNKSDSAAESKADVKKKAPAKPRGRPKKAKKEDVEEMVKGEEEAEDGDAMDTIEVEV